MRTTSSAKDSVGEGKDEEATFAGDNDAEEAAVGGDREFAEAEAVKNGNGRWLRDRDIFVGRDGGERGNG